MNKKIFINHVSNMGLVSGTLLNNKKTNPTEKCSEVLSSHFSEENTPVKHSKVCLT
jgi:hypothetical protein